MGTTGDDQAASMRITALAREITTTPPATAAEALQKLVDGAVLILASVDYAGAAVITRRTNAVATVASTGAYPRLLDAVQHAHQQGPSVDAAASGESLYIPDLAGERRWPGFGMDAVTQTPIRSIMAFEVFGTRRTLV